MELLLLLLFAHFVGDFYIQRESWIECRNTNHLSSIGLVKHTFSHLILMTGALYITGYLNAYGLFVASIITASHYLIDLWKSYRPGNLTFFLLDQALHLTAILIAWVALYDLSISAIQAYVLSLLNVKLIAVAGAYMLVCKPASIVIGIALKGHTERLEQKQSGLISAGSWIGYLERCLIISFVLTGQFAGVGFLLAAKTVFRFGDLTKDHDMKLTEYMMLGTLLSFFIALAIGWSVLTYAL